MRKIRQIFEIKKSKKKKNLGNLFIFSVNANNCAIISEKITNLLYQKIGKKQQQQWQVGLIWFGEST